jgi:hypothetical protein
VLLWREKVALEYLFSSDQISFIVMPLAVSVFVALSQLRRRQEI